MELIKQMLPAPLHGGFHMDGYWIWCGSAIKGEDGNYHLFASRWSKEQPMHPGWLFGSEIVRAVSSCPEGPYEFEEVVLSNRGHQYWDGMAVHNPYITKWGDSYLLYYIGTTWPFPKPAGDDIVAINDIRTDVARANKRIGLAWSNSIRGPWHRLNEPILKPRPDYFDNLYVSNPSPCFGADGSVNLLYKCVGVRSNPDVPGGHIHGSMQFGLACASRWNGLYAPVLDRPIFPDGYAMEDPFLWRDQTGFHMIAKDMTGRLCGEKYGGVYAHSENCINWSVEEGKLAYSRRVLFDDGIIRTLGNLDRPFILFEHGKPRCMFFAASNGTDSFLDATDTWNQTIPLVWNP